MAGFAMTLSCVLMSVLAIAGVAEASEPNAKAAGDRALYAAVDAMQHVLMLRGAGVDGLAMIRQLGSAECRAAAAVPAKLDVIARSNGVRAVLLERLTIGELEQAGRAVILKVRSTAEAKQPEHYVSLDRVESGEAIIYAGAGPVIRMPVAALRHYWNGEAIVVGSAGEAAEVASMSRWTWRVQVALVALGLITTAAMWRRARRLQRQAVSWPATAGQLAMLLAVAAGFGFAAKFVYAGRQIALETSARHDADVVLVNFDDPKVPVSQTTAHNISAAEFRAKLGEGALVLDVRGDEHYRPLHVAGAVSVPDLNEKAMRLRLAGVPKDRLILVYCADIKCPRGRVACGVLERLGFTNVLHYPEGWADLKTWTDLRFEKGEGTAP